MAFDSNQQQSFSRSMLISVATTRGDNLVSFQVDGDALIATIKTLIQAEVNPSQPPPIIGYLHMWYLYGVR